MKRPALLIVAIALGLVGTLGFADRVQAKPRIGFHFHVHPGYRPSPCRHGRYRRPRPVVIRKVYQVTPAPVAVPVPVAPRLPVSAPVDDHYCVEYRSCAYGPWQEYGAYDCHHRAYRVKAVLRARGYHVRVVHH